MTEENTISDTVTYRTLTSYPTISAFKSKLTAGLQVSVIELVVLLIDRSSTYRSTGDRRE